MANLEIIQQFHAVDDLYNIAITPSLVHNIMRNLPDGMMTSFNDQFKEFRNKDPANVRSPATFKFISQFVSKTEKHY